VIFGRGVGRGARARDALLAAFCALGAAVVGGLGLSGCGYSTGSLMPEGVRTLAVSVAANDTFYRQDELVYTRNLVAQLVRRAKVRVRDVRDADAILETRITRLGRLPLVEGEKDVVLEEGFIGTVEVVLRRVADGRVIDSFTVSRRSEAIFPRGESLDTARAELAAELAEDTVIVLERRSYLLERGLIEDLSTRPVTLDPPK
jgi:hypothetical protein